MVPTKLQPFPMDTFCEPGVAYLFPTMLEHLLKETTHVQCVRLSMHSNTFIV